MPGASRRTARTSSDRFAMSARTAAAMSGYCTFTATAVPSSSSPRWTCPIDAAAIATGSMVAKASRNGRRSARSITGAISVKGRGGEDVWSASSAWRNSPGISSIANDRTWPSFMASPLSCPRLPATRAAAARRSFSADPDPPRPWIAALASHPAEARIDAAPSRAARLNRPRRLRRRGRLLMRSPICAFG